MTQEFTKEEIEKMDLIDESKFPFTVDHTKCLQCQQQEREEHSCLCFSCQWNLSGVGLDLKRNREARRQFKDIESELDNFGITVYFDTDSISSVIAQVNEAIAKETNFSYREELNTQLIRIEQLVRLGLEWESGY